MLISVLLHHRIVYPQQMTFFTVAFAIALSCCIHHQLLCLEGAAIAPRGHGSDGKPAPPPPRRPAMSMQAPLGGAIREQAPAVREQPPPTRHVAAAMPSRATAATAIEKRTHPTGHASTSMPILATTATSLERPTAPAAPTMVAAATTPAPAGAAEAEPDADAASDAVVLASLEEGYMKWVGYIGSLQHSKYAVARNRLADHAYLVVDPRAASGSPTSSGTVAGAPSSHSILRFGSIQAAIDAVPDNNVVRTKILIAPGTYTEKVFIPYTKPFITLQGSNSNTTIIAWNDTANKKGTDNNTLGTYKSATVAIDAPYFIARNITFKNTSPRPIPRSNNSQAVALRISGDAAVFLGCQFIGAQDTLYDHKGRHFFQDCYVEGSVDFIFGDGLSMYRNCHLHAIGAPYQAVTAQNRGNPLDDSGFSFIHCKVTGSGPLYLGRAWGTFSRVIYSFTYMDALVLPVGWNDWNDPKRQLTVYYGQFRCYGPGANASGRVSWSKELTLQEAQPFLELTFIDGDEWSAST